MRIDLDVLVEGTGGAIVDAFEDDLPAFGVAGGGGGEREGERQATRVAEQEEGVVVERTAAGVGAPDAVAAQEQAEGAQVGPLPVLLPHLAPVGMPPQRVFDAVFVGFAS